MKQERRCLHRLVPDLDTNLGATTHNFKHRPLYAFKYLHTALPHLTAPLYLNIPGALPFFNPSMASTNCGPRPSSLISLRGYIYVLKEKATALVFGSLVSVCNSTLRRT